ncbi:MAG: hypothetical protein JEZ04_03830 [Spirochaetales bacterium]|nr:hypothetical protein [Spirochaetales bacterium]
MQKIKVFIVSIVVFMVITSAAISAQSTEVVDNLLSSETAGFGDSVYMIAVGSGLADDDSVSVSEAVVLVNGKGWNVSQKSADQAISLGELSFIIMQALDIEGGIMYSLMPSPRYAVRELKFLDLITEEAHPDKTVSGGDVINILSEAINMKEAR